MTFSRFPLAAIAVIILVLSACNCPPDEKMGDLSLGETARDFLAYDGTETLIFQNQDGEELRMTAPNGQVTNDDRLCYRTICTEAKFGSPSTCEYYAAESRRYTFFSDDNNTVIDLAVYSDLYAYGEPNFYDAAQVSVSTDNSIFSAYQLLGARFSEPFDSTELTITDYFTLTPEVEVGGQTFSDILIYEEGDLGVYLEPGNGIIGFKDADNEWLLQ